METSKTMWLARPRYYLPIWLILFGLAVLLQQAHFSYRDGWVPGGLLLDATYWVDGAILLRLILAAIFRPIGLCWLLYVGLAFGIIPLIHLLQNL